MLTITVDPDSYREEAYVRARDDGKVIGKVDVKLNWLWSLEVDMNLRHQGIGTRIVEKALEHIRERKYPHAYLYCKSEVLPFYSRMGWQIVNTTGYAGNKDAYILVKPCTAVV